MVFVFSQDLIEIGKADVAEGLERVGHEPFAAGFIDRGLHGVDDFNLKTLAGGSDGTCQSGWAGADNTDVALTYAWVHS
jgi:hypothetical protein